MVLDSDGVLAKRQVCDDKIMAVSLPNETKFQRVDSDFSFLNGGGPYMDLLHRIVVLGVEYERVGLQDVDQQLGVLIPKQKFAALIKGAFLDYGPFPEQVLRQHRYEQVAVN